MYSLRLEIDYFKFAGSFYWRQIDATGRCCHLVTCNIESERTASSSERSARVVVVRTRVKRFHALLSSLETELN